MKDFNQELILAKNLARQAGRAIRKIYRGKIAVRYKAKDDPVTEADLAANEIIIGGLKKFNYGLLSEESADDKSRLKKNLVWLIDPLDGTQDFIHKTGEFSVMIALIKKGRPVLGVVYQPLGDKLYYASAGRGAYLEKYGAKPLKLKVSASQELKSAKMLTSRFHLLPTDRDLAKKLGIKKTAPCGSSGLKIALIAAGQAELHANTSAKTNEWDIAAADIILKEAGGRLTDLGGKNFVYNKNNHKNLRGYAAANRFFHKKIIRAVNGG